MAIEEFSFAIHPTEAKSRSKTATWFRDSMEKVGLSRFGLAPMAHAAKWWSTADDLMLAGRVLGHAGFATESGDAGWAMALHYLAYEKHAGVVGSVPLWPIGDGGRSKVWRWLTEFLDRLVIASNADLCCVNGSGTGGEEDRLLSDAEMDLPIPRAVTAWNYFGPQRLTSTTRDGLRDLPAFRSESLGRGWLLQAVDDYADDLAVGFLQKYSLLVGSSAEFLRAPMKPPRPTSKNTGKRKKISSHRRQ